MPLLVLPVIIVGGIFSGVFTVTESAGSGRRLHRARRRARQSRGSRWKDIYDATLYSAVISAVAGMLLGAGAIVSWILTYNRVTQNLADLLPRWRSARRFMLIVVVVLLILGMLMDAVPIMIALAPLLAPIARQYGISDVQFGLVFVVTCMIGLVTPPVGHHLVHDVEHHRA